jgi:uracil phosphoribosyltransferase
MVFVSKHPLIAHHLAELRAAGTRPRDFRRLVRVMTLLLASEATADLATRGVTVETPLGSSPGQEMSDRVAIVPILRAGLGMAEGLLELIPDAEVWHLGLFRDEATLEPTEYYNKLPQPSGATLGIVVDPMLATGGSAVHACRILRESGIGRMKFMALIAAPEGVSRLEAAMPDVPIHVAALDPGLNGVGFINPGLGDAGDRQFNTAHMIM